MQIGPSRPRSKDMKRSTLGHGIKGQGHMRPQGHTVSIIVSRCQKIAALTSPFILRPGGCIIFDPVGCSFSTVGE